MKKRILASLCLCAIYGIATAEDIQVFAPIANEAQASPEENMPALDVKPSFDCTKARSRTEIIICSDQELSSLDAELGLLYQKAKASSSDQATFNAENAREWQKREATCTDKSCLLTWYAQRKSQLNDWLSLAPSANQPIPDNNQIQREQKEQAKYEAKYQLDEANKRINIVWNATTKVIRAALLPEQRQWLKMRENVCAAKAAAEEANDIILQDTIKLHCMAAMTDPRTEELKQKIVLLTNPPQPTSAPIATEARLNKITTQENTSASTATEPESTGTTYFILAVTAGLLLLIFYIKALLRKKAKAKREKEKKSIDERVDFIINKHAKTLALKRKQKTTHDDYGNSFRDKWVKEKNHFIEHVLKKDESIKYYLDLDNEISKYSYSTDKKRNNTLDRLKEACLISNEEIINKIEHAALVAEISINNEEIDVERLAPIEFENYCADVLRSNGWSARVTQASGDQGIDVIAQYGNIKAVFQCKKYSNPVGNGAVQEIFAGKGFERADIAAVVTNTSYTRAAKQLANTTGVHLLHYSELSDFADRISLS